MDTQWPICSLLVLLATGLGACTTWVCSVASWGCSLLGNICNCHCGGLKSEMKWHLGSSYKILCHLCGGGEHKHPQESGAAGVIKEVGSGHLQPNSLDTLPSLNACMSGERENS